MREGAREDPFLAATEVLRIGASSFSAELDAGYSIMGKPNGGYILSVLARAATMQLVESGIEHPHCLAASGSYIRSPDCGPAQVEVTVRRNGTRISQVQASLLQDGKVAAEALLSCGRLREDADVFHSDSMPVSLPDPADCESHTPVFASGGPSILDRVEMRLDPATTGFARGELSDDAEIRGWIRMAGGWPMGPLGLLLATDVLPPATFALGSTGWVPTIQLSVYVRALPLDGWLRARQRARTVTGGLVDEVCELWDESGRVVAQAVQLAMVRFG